MVLFALFALDLFDRLVDPKKPERKRIVDIGSFTGKPTKPVPKNIFDPNDPAFTGRKTRRRR